MSHKSRAWLIIFVGLAVGSSANAQMGPPTTRALLTHMQRKIEMKDFQNPLILKEALQLFYEHSVHHHKIEFPILVDIEAFKTEDPDAPDINETPIKFPPFPQQMPLATALRLALAQVPGGHATYLVRNGMIEVTTFEAASIRSLLQERVSAVFEKKPLAEAIEEVADATGLSVLVDPRIQDKMKTPITACLRGDAAAETVLRLLADMADLKIVVLPSCVYLTDPARADRLQEEQRDWLIQQPMNPKAKRVVGDPFAG